MKIKKILICGVLAFAALLSAGCSSGTDNSDSSASTAAPGNTGNSDPENNNSGENTATPGNTGNSDPESNAGENSGGSEGMNLSGNVGDVTPNKGDKVAEFEIEGFGKISAVLFPDIAPLGVENFEKLADAEYYNGLTIHRVVSNFMMQGGSLNGDGTGGDALVNGGSFGIETNNNARHFYGALCYANAAGTNTTQFYIVNDKNPQTVSADDAQNYYAYADQFEAIAKSMTDNPDYAAAYQQQADYYRSTGDSIKLWAENATDDIKAKYEKGGAPFLDGSYTVFGQVYEGFDVIDKIAEVEVKDNGSGEVSKPVQDIIITSVKVYDYGEEN